MVTAQERIEAILKYGGVRNVTAFASMLGLHSAQKIYDIQSGKVKSISPDLADKIFQAFPELSQEWVLSGRGEMLRGRDVSVGGSNFGRIHSDDINISPESVSITSDDVRELISQNGKLIDIIKELTKSK